MFTFCLPSYDVFRYYLFLPGAALLFTFEKIFAKLLIQPLLPVLFSCTGLPAYLQGGIKTRLSPCFSSAACGRGCLPCRLSSPSSSPTAMPPPLTHGGSSWPPLACAPCRHRLAVACRLWGLGSWPGSQLRPYGRQLPRPAKSLTAHRQTFARDHTLSKTQVARDQQINRTHRCCLSLRST